MGLKQNVHERLWPMVRESLAVLAAILIAFSLDAWWDERKERERMLDALDSVAAELERNIRLVEGAISENERSVSVSREVLQLKPGAVEQATTKDVQRWSSFPQYEEVRLQLGAITAFIEGGFLAELPDRQLRSRLAGIPRLQEEIDEEAQGVARLQWDMTERLTGLVSVDEAMTDDVEARMTAYLRALVEDEPMRHLVFNRSFALGEIYGSELVATRGELETILAELDAWRSKG